MEARQVTNGGWIPAWRKLFDPDHDLAPTRIVPASRGWAWLDICQMATHKPRQTAHSGTLGVGEMVASLRTLGRRWKWSKDKVRRFVRELEASTRIATLRETPSGTVYLVVNYETYATPPTDERDTQRDTQRDRGETAARQEQPLDHSTSTETDLFGNGVTPSLTASSIGEMCGRVGAEWKLKSGIKEWAAKLDGEARYARLDIPHEILRCAEYHEGNGKKVKAPDRAIRNWLDNQVRWNADRKLGATDGETGGSRPTRGGGFYVGN